MKTILRFCAYQNSIPGTKHKTGRTSGFLQVKNFEWNIGRRDIVGSSGENFV